MRPKKLLREKHKHILIALEDTKSSRFYVKELAKDKGVILNIAFARHIGTDPNSVLNAVSVFENENPLIKYEKAWLVIDKDSFTKSNFKGTLETCRQKDICVAYSNECYELWILLHFKEVSSYMTRVDILKELKKEFKHHHKMEYSKSENNIYMIIRDKQDIAIQRAEKLIQNIIKHNGNLDPYNDNPLTKMHLLVKCLSNLKKCKNEDYYNCNSL